MRLSPLADHPHVKFDAGRVGGPLGWAKVYLKRD